jgi:hypothetical protein
MESEIPTYGTTEYKMYAYQLMKENNRGHNYQYWNDDIHGKLLNEGWELHRFEKVRFDEALDHTMSELNAKEIVNELRQSGYYARIIVGMHKNVQKRKTFSIIKKKKNA